jgi:ankyrin repeat protein
MLIEHGTDAAAQNKFGLSPLHLALHRGRVQADARMFLGRGWVDSFVERYVDVTVPNNEGDTPLHLAMHKGQVDVARMLIECGVDTTSQNDNRESLLHRASTPSYLSRDMQNLFVFFKSTV